MIEKDFWRHLSPFQIRLTKAALLLADLLSFGFAGLLAAWLSERWSVTAEVHWLVTQDLERYWAWLAVVGLGIGFFLVRFRPCWIWLFRPAPAGTRRACGGRWCGLRRPRCCLRDEAWPAASCCV